METLKAPSVEMDLITGGRSFQRQALRYSTDFCACLWLYLGTLSIGASKALVALLPGSQSDPFLDFMKALVRGPLHLLATRGEVLQSLYLVLR